MAKGYKSPGVGYSEREIQPQISGPDTLAIGIVGGATKGPTELTLLTSTTQLRNVFGKVTAGDYGVWAAKKCLQNSGKVYFQRVLGKDAAKGSTAVPDGEETAPFIFETKEYDSTLEGALVKVEVDKERDCVYVRLFSGADELESVGYLTLDESSDKFVSKIFNKLSTLLNITRTQVSLANYEGGTYTIRGSNDGIDSLTVEDVIGTGNKGMQMFKSPDNIDISTLIVPGWSDSKVVSAAKDLVDYRGDVEFIPDPPQGMTPDQVMDWVDATGEYDSNLRMATDFFAFYYPWVYDYDTDIGESVLTPPSGWVASQYAYNDNVSGAWFAPAGIQSDNPRGLLAGAQGLEYELTKEERDKLYGDGVINPIIKFFGKGIVIWGNKTTKRAELYEPGSALCSVNVRRMCNYIRKIVISISQTEIFNPNDKTTWNSWRLKLQPKLRAIQENRGIEGFRVIMDETTVTEDDINNGRMPGEIYIKPVRAAEWIPINFVVTSDSVIFGEEGGEV